MISTNLKPVRQPIISAGGSATKIFHLKDLAQAIEIHYFLRYVKFRLTKSVDRRIMKLNKINIFKPVGQALLVAGLLGAAQQSAYAENDGFFFGKDAPGKWTIGAKVANVDPNVDRVKDANAIGIVLGYQFAVGIGDSGGTASVELEYLNADNTSDLVGFDTGRDLQPFDSGPIFNDNDTDFVRNPGSTPDAISYDAQVANLFFTYRSPGTLYYKLKGGLSYANVDVRLVDGELLDREDVSLAGGVGLGYRISDLGVVEVEYSADSGESDLGILGVNALLQF